MFSFHALGSADACLCAKVTLMSFRCGLGSQEGERCPLSGAISLCNVFDLEISCVDFYKGFNRVYNLALAKGLQEMYFK
jgi:predicted alpha/beta-fold hydrolase